MLTLPAHGFGHALWLKPGGDSDAEMYPAYTGHKRALSADGVRGVRHVCSSHSILSAP